MIVDELDHDPPRGGIDRAVGQGRRQGRNRMQILGPEIAVTAQAKRPEPLAPLVAGHVQGDPPERPPHRRRHAAEAQGLAVKPDLLQRLVLVPRESLLKLDQRLVFGSPEDAHEHSVLALMLALDRQCAVHPGMLVKPRPGKLQVRPPQRRVLGTHQGISFHEQAGPGRTIRMPGPGFEERREIHHPAHRRRGDLAGKVDKIPDEPPWSSQRKISSFWFVHPCTPKERRVGIGGDPERQLGPSSHTNCLGPGRSFLIRPEGPKRTRKHPSREGEAGQLVRGNLNMDSLLGGRSLPGLECRELGSFCPS